MFNGGLENYLIQESGDIKAPGFENDWYMNSLRCEIGMHWKAGTGCPAPTLEDLPMRKRGGTVLEGPSAN